MSTYVGIHCATCNVSSNTWNKNDYSAVWESIRAAHLIGLLQDTVNYDLTIEIGYFNDAAMFAGYHAGHELLIVDEYGYKGHTLDDYWKDRNKQ